MADDTPSVDKNALGEHDEERARNKRFRREQAWFLRQVVVDVPECAAVAFVLADHANQKSGLMYPSIATLAQIIGRSPRAVQPQLARLEEHGHIDFVGWVCLGGKANVKSWRWSLWDFSVEHRFDKTQIGEGRSRAKKAGFHVGRVKTWAAKARSGQNGRGQENRPGSILD